MRTYALLAAVLLSGPETATASELGAVRRLLKDPSPSARAAAVRRLTGDDSRPALQTIVDVLGDSHAYVRRAAAGVLGQTLDPRSRRRVRSRIKGHRNAALRAAACHAFALWFDAEGRAGLAAALTDRVPAVRIAALHALTRWFEDAVDETGAVEEPAPRRDDVASAARALAEDPDGRVRAHALDTVLRLGADRVPASRWTQALTDEDARVRLVALEGSVAISGEPAVFAVLHGLNDAVWSVRLAAAELARATRDRRVLERLVAHLHDDRRRVRDAVHAALVALSGIPFDPDPARWTAWLNGDGQSFDPKQAEPNPRAVLPKGTVTVVKALGVPVSSDHVAFVLDASGSMAETLSDGRTRWASVCAELHEALAALTKRKPLVSVHCFSSDVRSFPATRLSSTTRAGIERFLALQRPGGRTALFDGIAAALREASIDTIVVLSDGAPSAGTWFTKTDLLHGVRVANRFRKARIDVVAIGVDGIAKRWRDVLKRIAKEHGGTYRKR